MHNTIAMKNRFIDSRYNTLFELEDGEKVRITNSAIEVFEKTVKGIDEYHFNLDGRCYHICEFAEIMERNGSKYEPAPAKTLKEQAVEKVQGEYREFHDQLLEMSKAEILNRTWEILIKEEITVQIKNIMDSNDYTERQLQNMLATGGLLQDLFKACDDIPTVDPLIDCIENYFDRVGEQAISSLESGPNLNIKPPVQEKAYKTKGVER